MAPHCSIPVLFLYFFFAACSTGNSQNSDAAIKSNKDTRTVDSMDIVLDLATAVDNALVDRSTTVDVGSYLDATPIDRSNTMDLSERDDSSSVTPNDTQATSDAVTFDLQSPSTDAVTPADPKETLYIAVDGNDSNPGTKEKPLASIKQAATLAKPGTLIYLRGGKYVLSATVSVLGPPGTAQDPIRLWAYPGEEPVFNFSGGASLSKGLSIDASHWHVKGLTVEGSAGRGIQVSAGTGIIIEACTTRGNGDMGLVVSNGASYATILNCDSHHNFSAANGGENADGFGAKSNVGPGVVFRNCRAYNNADDGWDLYGAPSAVRIENCWAFKNGDNFASASNFNGDGNGFKLGHSAGDLAHHVVVNCLAWGNLGANGFEDNNNTGGLSMFNNVAYKNKGAGFEAIHVTKHIVKNNLSLQNGKADTILAGSDASNNSWNGMTVSEADFLSVDDSVAVGARLPDGSLPVSDFLRLKPESKLVDKGVDVGLAFKGIAPDLGAYEAK